MKIAPPKNAGVLIPLQSETAWLERRGVQSIIWGPDWWDGDEPLGVIAREITNAEAEIWVAGYAGGYKAGEREGHKRGFAACQAGLRALLGAASHADVLTLLKAAERARE